MVEAAHGLASHGDQVVLVLFGMVVVLLGAKLGGELAVRLRQPAVLGELAAGIVLGNLALVGLPQLDSLKSSASLQLMAEIGVILLLFDVGLETDMHELLAVGWSATIVAHLGVIAPMLLGYGVTAVFLPESPWYVHLFSAATLTATSVGITARVLQDLNQMETREARIILGAAVVDDVLGLIILAVVAGMVTSIGGGGGAVLEWKPVALIVLKAAAFLVGAIWVGRRIHINALKIAQSFRVQGVTLVLAVCYCFALAALAGWLGLAPIVGAFAAGLVIADDDYAAYQARGIRPVAELIKPLTAVFVPMFFVLMGLKVDLHVFGSTSVIGLAAALTVAAVIGKQVCAFGVIDKGVSRVAVGVGMIPRGEVGLIFTGIGAALSVQGKPVFDSSLISAMVVMVLLTTVMTPPLLQAVFRRR